MKITRSSIDKKGNQFLKSDSIYFVTLRAYYATESFATYFGMCSAAIGGTLNVGGTFKTRVAHLKHRRHIRTWVRALLMLWVHPYLVCTGLSFIPHLSSQVLSSIATSPQIQIAGCTNKSHSLLSISLYPYIERPRKMIPNFLKRMAGLLRLMPEVCTLSDLVAVGDELLSSPSRTPISQFSLQDRFGVTFTEKDEKIASTAAELHKGADICGQAHIGDSNEISLIRGDEYSTAVTGSWTNEEGSLMDKYSTLVTGSWTDEEGSLVEFPSNAYTLERCFVPVQSEVSRKTHEKPRDGESHERGFWMFWNLDNRMKCFAGSHEHSGHKRAALTKACKAMGRVFRRQRVPKHPAH